MPRRLRRFTDNQFTVNNIRNNDDDSLVQQLPVCVMIQSPIQYRSAKQLTSFYRLPLSHQEPRKATGDLYCTPWHHRGTRTSIDDKVGLCRPTETPHRVFVITRFELRGSENLTHYQHTSEDRSDMSFSGCSKLCGWSCRFAVAAMKHCSLSRPN